VCTLFLHHFNPLPASIVCRLAHEDSWREKYGMVIGTGNEYSGDYSTWLSRANFSLVSIGDGWSARAEDSILHGCIPVLISDNVEPVLHGAVDWSKFSVRVPQKQLADLPHILRSISPQRIAEMQAALGQVWTR
jgi:hypothetical protein